MSGRILFASQPQQQAAKYIIKHGWDLPYGSNVATHAATINALPIDGIMVKRDAEIFSQTAYTYAEMLSVFQGMPTMSNVNRNFTIDRMLGAVVYDWFDDAIWANFVSNAANIARAAKDSGKYVGIAFDNEYYGTVQDPWNYGQTTVPWVYSDTLGACPGHTAVDARQKVQQRGSEIMDAIKTNWPTAVIFLFHGAYTSESMTATVAFNPPSWNDVAHSCELRGVFIVGMVASAAGSQIELIDGGEVYSARSIPDMTIVHDWQKTGLADSGTVLIPSNLISTYKSTIRASQGVYDKSGGVPISSALMQSTMTNAIQISDRYTWLYTEAYNWIGTGGTPVPQEYIDAIAAAKATAPQNQ